jgi:5-methylcytosine-specific restriction protein A
MIRAEEGYRPRVCPESYGTPPRGGSAIMAPYAAPTDRQRAGMTAAQQPRATSAQRGYGRRWRKLRKSYLARHPVCVECLDGGYVVQATQVDHIVPLSRDGTVEECNLQALCTSCHSRKTVREGGGFGGGGR